MYFLFSSLIPSHLSLRSRSLEIASSILAFLPSFLFLLNSLDSSRNSFGFLSFAPCFLFPSVVSDFLKVRTFYVYLLGVIWELILFLVLTGP